MKTSLQPNLWTVQAAAFFPLHSLIIPHEKSYLASISLDVTPLRRRFKQQITADLIMLLLLPLQLCLEQSELRRDSSMQLHSSLATHG